MSLCTLLLTLAPGKEKKRSQWAVNLPWHSSRHCLLVLGNVKVTCGTCLWWVWPAWDGFDAQLSDTSHRKQPESKHGLKRTNCRYIFSETSFTSRYPGGCRKSEGKLLNSLQIHTKTKGLDWKKNQSIILIVLLLDKAICTGRWQNLTN